MAKAVVKALMRISEAGSKPGSRMLRQNGFTLLELLVVLSIAALLVVGASLALPSGAHRHLEQEAQKTIALLETARAQSRASGQAVKVLVNEQGMRFSGAQTDKKLSTGWLYEGTSAASAHLVLGPEPVIAPQSVHLFSTNGASSWIVTDGVRPFVARNTP